MAPPRTAEGPLAAGNRTHAISARSPHSGALVREEQVITMEEAIRKMTSANAASAPVRPRPAPPGMAADVTVFNAATIIDNATYEKPHQYASGVEYVIVNGKMVLEHGKHSGARPGAILLGPGKKL
jgi:N-acyl-D-aspartate/D-glutamate deacylase